MGRGQALDTDSLGAAYQLRDLGQGISLCRTSGSHVTGVTTCCLTELLCVDALTERD